MKMKAVILNKPGDYTIADIEKPEPKDDEVLIHIYASGICTNDVRDFRGECNYTYPRIGGHEYCGLIEKLGAKVDKHRFAVGQKVVQYIIDDCKSCYYCKRGEENICEGLPHTKTFQNPDGISGYCGFAEYITAKAEDVFVYPQDTPFEAMALTEPLACVVNSVTRANIRLGDDVLVIGGGTMGMLHVMLAQLKGARVILSEPQAERREKALQLGAAYALDPTAKDFSQKLMELTEGRGADVVFNTTAIPALAKSAIAMTAPGGTVIMFSSMHPDDPVPVDMGIVHSFQKTITGSVSPTISAYHQAVLLIGKKLLSPLPLVEAVIPYQDYGKAMEMAMRPDTYKVILKFGDFDEQQLSRN